MQLREYQKKALEQTRAAFTNGAKSVCVQAPTGSGKTVLFSAIVRMASQKANRVWVIVPRNELLEQASSTLSKFKIPHGRIAAGSAESRAFNVHIVSKDTLIRRLDRIKNWPDLVIVDEAHLALDRYLMFKKRIPGAHWIGVTATPERLDGRGLSEMYDVLILGPTIRWLAERGYLSDCEYYCPPLQGIENLHRRGTDYVADELEQLLEERKIYGEAISHYKKHADGRPALVFCRSIQSADKTADKFCSAGYRFENIDGTMSLRARQSLIDGLKDGRLQGLTSCELITYGLDVPRVGAIIMLRPTMSRTLYFQMIGRGLRPAPGKPNCIILDHVGNYLVHGHPMSDHAWQFEGREKRVHKPREELRLKLCPEIGFKYCNKPSCVGCEHNKSGRKRRELKTVDTELVKVESVPLNHRPPAERQDLQDRINDAVSEYYSEPSNKPLNDLLDIAASIGRDAMWVYWRLNQERKSVNVPLLYEIRRLKGYKPGWAYFQKKSIEKRLGRK